MDSESGSSSPRQEQWELVVAEQELHSPKEARHASIPSGGGVENLLDDGTVLEDMDFESLHAKAVASICTEVESPSPDLPVSSNFTACDVQTNDGCLSEFSSGFSDYENLKETRPTEGPSLEPIELDVCAHAENGSPKDAVRDMTALKEPSPKENSVAKAADPGLLECTEKPVEVAHCIEMMSKETVKTNCQIGMDDNVEILALPNLPRHVNLQQKSNGIWDKFSLEYVKNSCFQIFHHLIKSKEWRVASRNVGMMAVSALIAGLYLRNRSLSRNLKRKHEEIARLMVTLMNLQDLLASNRSNAPLLRHASLGIHHSY